MKTHIKTLCFALLTLLVSLTYADTFINPVLVNPNIQGGAVSASTKGVPALSTTTPVVDGTAAVGVGTTAARADHVHPTDTSRLATGAAINTPSVGATTPGTGTFTTLTSSTLYVTNSRTAGTGALLSLSTAPTVASGFGTTPTVLGNGTSSFAVNVGTGGTASSGVLTMGGLPTTNGWSCTITNPLTGAGTYTQASADTTTTVTLTNYTITTAIAVPWVASYTLKLNCIGR